MLKLNAITKKFNENTIIDNINLEIEKNSILVLIGSNGSGKTTLLKIIGNAIPPNKGELVDKAKIQEKIVFLNERPNIYPEMRVEEQINFIGKINHIDSKKIKEKAKLCSIEGVLNFKASDLSAGFKQRLSLCLALLTSPSLLILDEPCNALDYVERKKFYKSLLELKKEMNIVVATHMLNDIEDIASNLYMINRGALQKIDLDSPIVNQYKERIQA